VAVEAVAVGLTAGSAITHTLVAGVTDAAKATASDGYTIAEVQLACSTSQAVADLLPKCDCVVETNRFPYRRV
jgi:hypothetical protein